jgi:hypothetical protein
MTIGAAIRKRFPDRIPILLCGDKANEKFLAPAAMTVREFNALIRQRMALPAEQALFLFVMTKEGSCIASAHGNLAVQYASHKKEDDCLHMRYAGENTFGTI